MAEKGVPLGACGSAWTKRRTSESPPFDASFGSWQKDLDELLAAHRELELTRSAPGRPGATFSPTIAGTVYDYTTAAIKIARSRSARSPPADAEPKQPADSDGGRADPPFPACPYCVAHWPGTCSFHGGVLA